MAAAGTPPTPTKHPRAREERERARKSAAEHLQQASAEIDKARQEATADVRRSLDSALERMRDVSGELCQRARTKPLSGRTHSSIRVIRLGARWATAIRAQRTPEALEGLPDEIRKQKTRAGAAGGRRATVPRANRRSPAGGTGPAAKGCVECRIQSAAGGPVAVLPESVRPVGRVEARWPRSTSWS